MPEDICRRELWFHSIQELLRETGSDLIFQKYEKISTPTASCSGGILEGSIKLSLVVSSHPPFGFPFYWRSLVSEHKAYIKNSKRGLKAVLVFNIQDSRRISRSAIRWCILCFRCRITFVWQSYFRHFLNMFIWNKNLHEPLLHNSKWVWSDSSPKIDSKSPPGPQLACSVTTRRWLLSWRRLWGVLLALVQRCEA